MAPHNVTALLPMKGHSARLPRKNVRPICGRPLFHWVLESLSHARNVDHIVVETDSDEIAHEASRNFKVQILRRPAELIGDTVPMNALIEYHLNSVESEIYLQTHATNPLLTHETIDCAIEKFREEGDHDSLFSVTPLQTRLFWPDGRAINHNPDELLPTQDLPVVYEENSNMYVFTKKCFYKRRHRIGKTPVLFPMNRLEAVDIDDFEAFKFAEFLLKNRE